MKDATYWAEQIKHGAITSEELLQDTIKRIDQQNTKLNALVEVREDLTRQWISTRQKGNGLFEGVFLPLKMLGQNKQGLGNTLGSRIFKNAVAHKTDHFVQQLEKSGFIPFGKTNSPEFGFKNITDPVLYGPTKNVWHTDYSAGGSSGGAASAVASGMFPIASASDGGGSIRIPASFSGLIGLKPTRGRTPKGPGIWRGWQGAAIDFALTISVRDTARLLAEMQVIQEAAPYQTPLLPRNELMNITGVQRKLSIAVATDSPVGMRVSSEAIKAVKQAASFLADEGHEIVEIPYPIDGLPLIQSYFLMNGGETAAMISNMEQHLGRAIGQDEVEAATWALLQYGKHVSAKDYINCLTLWDSTAELMEQRVFEQFDVLLTPTTAHPAPKIDEVLVSEKTKQQVAHITEFDKKEQEQIIFDLFARSLELTPFTYPVNLTGGTAISLPTHVTASGLPLGIQFMGRKGSEILLLQLAKTFESAGKFSLPTFWRDQS